MAAPKSNVCSKLARKLGFSCWKPTEGPETEPANKKKRKRPIRTEGNLDTEVKRTTRIIQQLPRALESKVAYRKGGDTCGTCNAQMDDYKQTMRYIKMLCLLADGVVDNGCEKLWKQIEEGDHKAKGDADNKEYGVSRGSGREAKQSKGVKDYESTGVLEHSLLCVLVNLQRHLGEILVQVCYVKSKDVADDEVCKRFDMTLGGLRMLSYAYTDLTDKIIVLFNKGPLTRRTNRNVICVYCVKEKLTAKSDFFKELANTGKKLNLMMKNKNDGNKGQCCKRGFPHVHADIQGRPFVLKYSLVRIVSLIF